MVETFTLCSWSPPSAHHIDGLGTDAEPSSRFRSWSNKTGHLIGRLALAGECGQKTRDEHTFDATFEDLGQCESSLFSFQVVPRTSGFSTSSANERISEGREFDVST